MRKPPCGRSRSRINRTPHRAGGSASAIEPSPLFTGAVALTVALATWSINDPSLNHATDQRAHNVLGRPGAVVADLAMARNGLRLSTKVS
jgi:hypothetical protein